LASPLRPGNPKRSIWTAEAKKEPGSSRYMIWRRKREAVNDAITASAAGDGSDGHCRFAGQRRLISVDEHDNVENPPTRGKRLRIQGRTGRVTTTSASGSIRERAAHRRLCETISGRSHQREWRPDVEQLYNPTNGPVLSRRHRQPVSMGLRAQQESGSAA